MRKAPPPNRQTRTIGLLALILAASMRSLLGQTPPTGRIEGSVLADGKPVQQAAVLFSRDPSQPPTPRPILGHVRTLADGSFAIPDLPDGSFRLCVQTAGMLDPCLWSDTQTVVAITGGQTATGIQLALRKAAVLPVRIEDPTQLLDTRERESPVGRFSITVRTRWGILHPGRLVSKDGKGRDYELVVPFDTPINLRAHHASADIQDENGRSVTRTPVDIPVVAPSNAPIRPIVLRVAGPR